MTFKFVCFPQAYKVGLARTMPSTDAFLDKFVKAAALGAAGSVGMGGSIGGAGIVCERPLPQPRRRVRRHPLF